MRYPNTVYNKNKFKTKSNAMRFDFSLNYLQTEQRLMCFYPSFFLWWCFISTDLWFLNVENMDRITDSSHKNWIYSIMQNVMEFAKFWMDTSKVGQ